MAELKFVEKVWSPGQPSAPQWESVLSCVRNEITATMWVAGGVVIDGWLEKDPDIIELAGEDATNLACLVFAAMRRAQSAALRASASARITHTKTDADFSALTAPPFPEKARS